MKIGFSLLRTVCVCMGLIFPVAASAATEIAAGTNFTDSSARWTVSGSPYLLKGNVSVQSGGILTIDAGVTVQFDTSATLSIENNSALIARGELGKEILFTAPAGSTYAAKIKFSSGSKSAAFEVGGGYIDGSGSILEYVVVENIGDLSGNTGGTVQIEASSPFIHLSTFRNNHSPAVGATGIAASGVLKIIGNTFTGQVHGRNGGAIAIEAKPGSQVVVADNIARNNITSGSGGGFWFSAVDNLEVVGNIVENNIGAAWGGGIRVSDSNATLMSNTVRDNRSSQGGGIVVDNALITTPVKISANVVVRNVSAGMGGGIYLYRGTNTVEHNIIAANTASTHVGGLDLHAEVGDGPIFNVHYNVIAENSSTGDVPGALSAWAGGGIISFNAIVENTSRPPVRLTRPEFMFQNNTVAANALAPSQYGTGSAAVLVGPDMNGANILDNNFIGNATSYDLAFEGTSGTLTIGSNWWGSNADPLTATPSRLTWAYGGTIALSSWSTALISANPIAPPTGVVATAQGESAVHVAWNPVEGSYGYRVYWGTNASPDFEHVQDVPACTTCFFDITDLNGGNYYVAVTALKSDYMAANDLASTPVNDNMTNGTESWYGNAPTKAIIVESDLAVTVSGYSQPGNKYWNGQIAADDDVVHHRIVVTNNGPSDASDGYSVMDFIPDGMTAYTGSLPADCTMMGRDVMCSRLALALGASDIIDIPLQFVDKTVTAHVVFTNTVEVTPNGKDPELSNNQATLTLHVNTNDLAVSWLSPALSALSGTNTTYTVKTRNNGRVSAQAASLSVALPADVTVISIPDGCTLAGSAITCPVGAVAANSEVLSLITVSAAINGQMTLNAEVTSSDASADADASNNVAAATTIFASPVDPKAPAPDTGGGGGVMGMRWLILLFVILALRRYAVFRTVATAQ